MAAISRDYISLAETQEDITPINHDMKIMFDRSTARLNLGSKSHLLVLQG
jgi:hypothetical protein